MFLAVLSNPAVTRILGTLAFLTFVFWHFYFDTALARSAATDLTKYLISPMLDAEPLRLGIWLLIPTSLAIGSGILWQWAGASLPPASDVGRDTPGGPIDQVERRKLRQPTDGTSDRSIYRVAASHIYQPPPILQTVTVRAFLLIVAIVIFSTMLMMHFQLLSWLIEKIESSGRLSIVVGAIFLLIALLAGTNRQMNVFLYRASAAGVAVDGRGEPFFSYIGTVPSMNWLHSPRSRAALWLGVTATSLFAALVLSAQYGDFVLIVIGRMIVTIVIGALLAIGLMRAFRRRMKG
jgi:hypothetical protein